MTLDQLLLALLSGAFSAGGAYAAVRVELSWLRRDVDRAHERIDRLERPRRAGG